jgi:hypothetical protein
MKTEIGHLEATVRRRILKEALIIVGGTVFFFVLCATAGISLSAPPAPPAAEAAYETEQESDDLDPSLGPSCKPQDPLISPLSDGPTDRSPSRLKRVSHGRDVFPNHRELNFRYRALALRVFWSVFSGGTLARFSRSSLQLQLFPARSFQTRLS